MYECGYKFEGWLYVSLEKLEMIDSHNPNQFFDVSNKILPGNFDSIFSTWYNWFMNFTTYDFEVSIMVYICNTSMFMYNNASCASTCLWIWYTKCIE